MLFYMQMKNWFLIFLMVTMAYIIQQKSSHQSQSRLTYQAATLPLVSLLK